MNWFLVKIIITMQTKKICISEKEEEDPNHQPQHQIYAKVVTCGVLINVLELLVALEIVKARVAVQKLQLFPEHLLQLLLLKLREH